jgi:hypothetical protein
VISTLSVGASEEQRTEERLYYHPPFTSAGQSPHAGAGDVIDRNMVFFEPLENANMTESKSATPSNATPIVGRRSMDPSWTRVCASASKLKNSPTASCGRVSERLAFWRYRSMVTAIFSNAMLRQEGSSFLNSTKVMPGLSVKAEIFSVKPNPGVERHWIIRSA